MPSALKVVQKNSCRKGNCLRIWRRWRDSNPRAAHHGYTISSRARYDHFDTSPYKIVYVALTSLAIYLQRFLVYRILQEFARGFGKFFGKNAEKIQEMCVDCL